MLNCVKRIGLTGDSFMMKLSQKQKKQIEVFRSLSLKQNQSINLFSRKSPDSQWDLLFDRGFQTGKCLYPVLSSLQKEPVLDIGSGNGFPGLLFSILYPKSFFYLCERNRKKAEFLKWILNKAKVGNAEILCKNAEDIDQSFEIILSQAALPIKKVLNLLKKLLSLEGEAFLWKNSLWRKEWPEKSCFSPKVFKSYKSGVSEQVLLRVKKI